MFELPNTRLNFDTKNAPYLFRVSSEYSSRAPAAHRSTNLSMLKFGFINGVDNVNWPPYRDSKS